MKKQINYYEKLRRKFFSKREIVGWGSRNSQEMRFKVLEEILKKYNCKTVLDIGCGRGDLISYLKKKKISIRYTGLDINDKFIDIAKKLNPKNNFIFADFLKKDLSNFDVIFISGLFNLKMQNHKKWMKLFIDKAIKKTKKILIFNCLSNKAPQRKKKFFYINPKNVISDFMGNNKKFIIDHSYADHDVSFIIFK